MKLYTCTKCNKESNDEDEFETDLLYNDDYDEMTCEDCYDEIDSQCN